MEICTGMDCPEVAHVALMTNELLWKGDPAFAGLMASEAVTKEAPRLAVIVIVWVEATALVVIVKVALLWPAAIGSFGGAGTTAAGLSDSRVMFTPPGGAGPDRAAVAMTEFPPTTVLALKVKLVSVGTTAAGCTVKAAALDDPPPGAGLDTTTARLPAAAKSEAASVMVS